MSKTDKELAVDLICAEIKSGSDYDYGKLVDSAVEAVKFLDKELGKESKWPSQKPAVPVEESVTDDFIVCLEDGKKLKMLKRYLRAQYDMSVQDYKSKWNLPHDYPTTAPAYSDKRSSLAKEIGLGKGSAK